MIFAIFLVKNKIRNTLFFEKTFLLINISINITLIMFSLTLNNTNIYFSNSKIIYRLYTIAEIFSITKQINLIKKITFAKVVINLSNKTFILDIILF